MNSLDIIVPILNAEDDILELVNSLNIVREQLKDTLNVNVLFVNDGSIDNSIEILKKISWEQKHVKIINLSKNFGYQIALSAGLDNSNADYVCIINTDIKDPPSFIADMYNKSLEGFDIVLGEVAKSRNDNFYIKKLKYITDVFFKKFFDVEISLYDDFIFVSKKIVEVLKTMPENQRFIREMINWSGFKSTKISLDLGELYYQNKNCSFLKLFIIFLKSMMSFSAKPLRLVYLLAGILAVMSFVSFIKLNLLSSTILFTGTVVTFSIGLVGSYIARIYYQVKNRPLYIIKDKFNF